MEQSIAYTYGKEELPNKQQKHMKDRVKAFAISKQEGIGVVEIILILVIIIGLVLIFREQITEILNNILESITGDVDSIINS